MGKNILMTTMSTLNRTDTVNYYFSTGTEGESPLFCDGISAPEDGSKYILSKYPIDEILVVGSSETFSREDQTRIENLMDDTLWHEIYREWTQDYQRRKGKKNGEEISAFEFYKMRIIEFIQQKDVISSETVFESVSEKERRKQIEEITLDVVRRIAVEEGDDTEDLNGCIIRCMMSQEKSRSLVKELRTEITNEIERSFQEEEGYLRYIQQGKELISRHIEADAKGQEYHKIREDIERDASLSILEREFLFVSLLRKIDALYFEKQKIHMEAEIETLKVENASLQYQIQNLKNQRAKKELAFAQYVLYRYLDSRHKMRPYMQKKISMRFIPEKVTGENKEQFDNVAEIVNEIYGVQEGDDKSGEGINVYVDMQGGSRTSGYVRNAVLSILNNQETNNIQIREIIATEFNPQNSYVSEIVDETKRYRIHDLVSGMNAFIRYGKADMLVKYCEDMEEEEDSHVRRLVNGMKKIDDAISLCNPQELRDGIENLSQILNTEPNAKAKSYVSSVFQVLEDGIRRDYGNLLSGTEVDYLELVDWCRRKGLIQQALTIIEDKMPGVIMKQLISIRVWRKGDARCRDMATKELSEALGASPWEKRRENILFYGLTRKIKYSEEATKRNEEFCSTVLEKICRVYLSKMCSRLNEDEMTERILGNLFYNKDNIFAIAREIGECDPKIRQLPRLAKEEYHQRKIDLWIRLIEIYKKQNEIRIPLNLRKRVEGNLVDENRVRRQEKSLWDKYIKKWEIADDYCLFREMCAVYERGRHELKNIFLDAAIYTALAVSGEEYWMQIIDGTALGTLAGFKEEEYEFKYEDNGTKIMALKAELHYPSKRMELEKLLLLHEALKNERNNSNHASEQGIRLPLKIVDMTIQEYIIKFRSLIEQDCLEE